MYFSEDDIKQKPTITISKSCSKSQMPSGEETPVVTIESDDFNEESRTETISPRPHRHWLVIVVSVLSTVLFFIILGFGYIFYRTYINIGVPVSVKSDENIAKLQIPAKKTTPGVVMTGDSILGVGLNFYELRGLKAEISFTRPDTADADVYLYSRSSDFSSFDPKTNQYLGSMVVAGREMPSFRSRIGYCAMANDNVVIGVARDEKVKDYCVKRKGYFFRQFVLVSDGVLPSRFYLHGKVERKALGRMGNKLYYIESRNPEALWAFADAIREYGFTDAIYITGGSDHAFYRTSDGKCHTIGSAAPQEDMRRGEGIVPWLVFKKR